MDKQNKKVIDRSVIGTVMSTRMNKTIIVAVTTMTRHPIYRKAMKRTSRFAVHNERQDIAVGDKVRISQTKPMSKTKHYILIEKIGK